jgi:hypothetical protein
MGLAMWFGCRFGWRDLTKQRGFLGNMPKELVGTHSDVVEEARRAHCVWWLGLCDLLEMLNGPNGLVEQGAAADETPPWYELQQIDRSRAVI